MSLTTATPVGLDNYKRVFTDPALLGTVGHAFFLIIFYTLIPVSLGLLIAALVQELRVRGLGTAARTSLVEAEASYQSAKVALARSQGALTSLK